MKVAMSSIALGFLSGLKLSLQVLWHFFYILGSSSRSLCSIPSVKWQQQCWFLPNPVLPCGRMNRGRFSTAVGWKNSIISLSAALPSQTEFQLSIWQWWVLGIQELMAFAEHLQACLVGLYWGRFPPIPKADEHWQIMCLLSSFLPITYTLVKKRK